MIALLIPCGVILVGSWTALRLGARFTSIESASLRFAIGIGTAPFVVGITGVAVLAALPGASPILHAALTVALLAALGWFGGRPAPFPSPRPAENGRGVALIALIGLGLLWYAALALPREINDAVEYAIVVRDLLETRDLLGGYPRLDSTLAPSGFFFAWTHPPTFVVLQYLFAAGDPVGATGLAVRIVDPWVTTATLLLVVALGERVRAGTGILAALLTLATPLYFLGSVGGLIDPLPVLAGGLAAAAMIAFPAAHWAAPGVLLGMALWSHSVAVLLVPMAVVARVLAGPRTQWVPGLPRIAGLAATASVVAAPPFLWNLIRTGHLVSDSPAVVAAANHQWETFYDFTRGVSTVTARMQYGVLKGAFAPEAYGIVFILAGVGALLAVAAFASQVRSRSRTAPDGLLSLAAWPICFVLGSAATVAIGTNVLVRNERLLLSVLVPSAVLASYAVRRAAGVAGMGRWPRALSPSRLRGLVALGLLGALLVLARFALAAPDHDLAFAHIRFIDAHAARGARVLSFRPGDFVFADTRVISHLDPALLPTYRAPSAGAAAEQLRRLGIAWIHVHEPTPPSLTHTMLAPLLADRSLTRLMFDDGPAQVYALGPAPRRPGPSQAFPPESLSLSAWRVVNIGGRKALGTVRISAPAHLSMGESSTIHVPAGSFDRHIAAFVATAPVELPLGSTEPSEATGVESRELRIEAVLSGRGFVKAFVERLDAGGSRIPVPGGAPAAYLADLVLEGRPLRLDRRVLLPPDAGSIRLVLHQYGNSSVRLDSLRYTLFR